MTATTQAASQPESPSLSHETESRSVSRSRGNDGRPCIVLKPEFYGLPEMATSLVVGVVVFVFASAIGTALAVVSGLIYGWPWESISVGISLVFLLSLLPAFLAGNHLYQRAKEAAARTYWHFFHDRVEYCHGSGKHPAVGFERFGGIVSVEAVRSIYHTDCGTLTITVTKEGIATPGSTLVVLPDRSRKRYTVRNVPNPESAVDYVRKYLIDNRSGSGNTLAESSE